MKSFMGFIVLIISTFLVTNNMREFEWVRGLMLEDWLK